MVVAAVNSGAAVAAANENIIGILVEEVQIKRFLVFRLEFFMCLNS